MGRCFGCYMDSCGFSFQCTCDCHVNEFPSKTSDNLPVKETKKDDTAIKEKTNKTIYKKASKIMERSKLADEDWSIIGNIDPLPAGNDEGHWVTIHLFVPKK